MTNTHTDTDTLQRFLFQDTCVRGEIVRLDNTLDVILKQNNFPPKLCDLLSQTLCATSLLSGILKYDGQLTLQFQGTGPVKMLVAKCDNHYRMRATAQWDEKSLPSKLHTDFERGNLVITIQNNQTNLNYQSIVAINHQSIAESLENYFLQSEQLETRLWLAYDHIKQQAAGLLLQKLPTEENQTSENTWQHIQTLANTLTHQELLSWDNSTLLNNLFCEETIQLFEPHPVQFHCPCDAKKMLHSITLLGEKEALEVLETHRYIEVTCEYCKNQFQFNQDEINRLFTKH
jgi:molecular chaperone Hsp33